MRQKWDKTRVETGKSRKKAKRKQAYRAWEEKPEVKQNSCVSPEYGHSCFFAFSGQSLKFGISDKKGL